MPEMRRPPGEPKPPKSDRYATLRLKLDSATDGQAAEFWVALRGREIGGGRARIISVRPDKPTPKIADATEEHEATDRLTRLCDVMTVALESHSEYVDGDIKGAIMLDSMEEKRGGLVLHGWDDSSEAMVHIFEHLKAVFAANGMTLQVHQIPMGGSDN